MHHLTCLNRKLHPEKSDHAPCEIVIILVFSLCYALHTMPYAPQIWKYLLLLLRYFDNFLKCNKIFWNFSYIAASTVSSNVCSTNYGTPLILCHFWSKCFVLLHLSWFVAFPSISSQVSTTPKTPLKISETFFTKVSHLWHCNYIQKRINSRIEIKQTDQYISSVTTTARRTRSINDESVDTEWKQTQV